MSLASVLSSPRLEPWRRAAAVALLFVAPDACAVKSNPYVDVPGTGVDRQLTLAPTSGDRTVALGGDVDVVVSKSERWEREVCTGGDGGCDSTRTCDDGLRSIPLEAEMTCDPADCTVERRGGNTFRIHPLHDGTVHVRAHARALDRAQTWDDVVAIPVARADGVAVTHDPLGDAGGVLHAALPGASFAWCAALYRDLEGSRDPLFSVTPLVSFALPTEVVEPDDGERQATGEAGVEVCEHFRAVSPGAVTIVVNGAGVRDREIPFRVADSGDVVGAEVREVKLSLQHETYKYGSLQLDPERDVTSDPVAATPSTEVLLHHASSGVVYAVVLRLRDGGTALGGARLLALSPPWVAEIARTSRSDVDGPPSVQPFVELTACLGSARVPLDDAGGAPLEDASASDPRSDAGVLSEGDADAPGSGADAEPPDASPESDAEAAGPSGYVVYDCSPGTARLVGDPFGASLDVPVIVPAW